MQATENPCLLVITHCPDTPSAELLARTLLEKKLAACINILSPCHSLYHWQGSIHSNSETPLFIKTTTLHYPALETTIQQQHPYELPEIIALPLTQGLPAYLNWLQHTLHQTQATQATQTTL